VKMSHRRCRGGLLSLLRTLQQVAHLVGKVPAPMTPIFARADPVCEMPVLLECVCVCVWLCVSVCGYVWLRVSLRLFVSSLRACACAHSWCGSLTHFVSVIVECYARHSRCLGSMLYLSTVATAALGVIAMPVVPDSSYPNKSQCALHSPPLCIPALLHPWGRQN
jgi:hypothetical protein